MGKLGTGKRLQATAQRGAHELCMNLILGKDTTAECFATVGIKKVVANSLRENELALTHSACSFGRGS